LAFIYPLKWAHVFIPVLPLNVLGFLDAPMPFIFGTHPDALRRRPAPDEV
jgi:DENN (AEX-3) domain